MTSKKGQILPHSLKMGEQRRNFYHSREFAQGLIDLQTSWGAAALTAHLSRLQPAGETDPAPQLVKTLLGIILRVQVKLCGLGGGRCPAPFHRPPPKHGSAPGTPLHAEGNSYQKQIDIYGSLCSTEIAGCKHSCEKAS